MERLCYMLHMTGTLTQLFKNTLRHCLPYAAGCSISYYDSYFDVQTRECVFELAWHSEVIAGNSFEGGRFTYLLDFSCFLGGSSQTVKRQNTTVCWGNRMKS